MFYSPLRYPGGKNKLAKFLAKICIDNKISGHYVEPYAGGAGVALFLLIEGYVKEITINDIDRSVYAFWHSILNETDRFVKKIRRTEISLKNREKQKKVQSRKNTAALFELGFSTFFLNRTNMSGILNAGPIGGKGQLGQYKIDCRFNKEELIKRIKLVAKYKDNIRLYDLDALKLIDVVMKKGNDENTIFYFDPPYYLKGQSLYLNAYENNDHEQVSEKIKNIKNVKWIVSYDNTNEIKKLYKGIKKIEYSFTHNAREAKEGKEVLFFSKGIKELRVDVNPIKITM